jgi:molybdopterin biosynthesis enzyme
LFDSEIGSDVASGELMLVSGSQIGAAEMGLLALSGRRSVTRFRPPTVAVLSTVP